MVRLLIVISVSRYIYLISEANNNQMKVFDLSFAIVK